MPVGLPSPAMGHEGAAGDWRNTQRPTGATGVVVVSVLVFLFGSASLASGSHHHICPPFMSSVKLIPYETAYFTSSALEVRFRVEAEGCVNDTLVLPLSGLKVSNQTSEVYYSPWYEFSFINCGNYVVEIGSKTVKLKHSSNMCLYKPITVSTLVESPTLLGRQCSKTRRRKDEVQKGKTACRALTEVVDTSRPNTKPTLGDADMLWDLLEKQKQFDMSDLLSNPSLTESGKDDGKSLFDTPGLFFGGEQEPTEGKVPNVTNGYISDALKPQSFNFNDFFPGAPPTLPSNNLNTDDFFENETFSKGRNYKENSIPIFIGIVAFTVSMCLRFCLCRGKSVVRRVTTVTVIRSRPANSDAAQDQQDLPPAYVDVVNENTDPGSPTDDTCTEPPPPAYADIAHEVLPPTYSEVEAQSIPPAEAASLANQESATQPSSPPPDPGLVHDDKDSGASRSMLSKYRSQQKQYAFKVLDEDE